MAYSTISQLLKDITMIGMRLWKWWKAPGSLHDSESHDEFIKDLEGAGAEFQSTEGNMILVKFPDGEALLDRAYGDYKLINEKAPGHPENEITVLPQ